MCPKRRQNLHLASIQRNKHTDDEQGVVQDYMVFQNVLRYLEKWECWMNEGIWGPIRLCPETYGFKGPITWSSNPDPVSSYYASFIDETDALI
jgi:hypothetical protein